MSRSFIQKANAMAWARQVEQKIDAGGLIGDLGALNRLLVRDLAHSTQRYGYTVKTWREGRGPQNCKISVPQYF